MNTGVNNKRVFYVAPHRPQGFARDARQARRRAARHAGAEEPGPSALEILAAAHAYQIGSARDELAGHYQAGAELFGRTPESADRLHQRRRLRHRRREDLHRARHPGRQSVGRQRRGGRRARHRHDAVPGQARRRDRPRAARRHDRSNRADYIGREAFGRTIGIVGLGNVGRRIAELAGGLFHMQVLAYDPYLSADVVRARGADQGRARRSDAPLGFRLDQLSAHRRDPQARSARANTR